MRFQYGQNTALKCFIRGKWLHLKAFAEHSSKDENTAVGHIYLGSEDLQLAKKSSNGTQPQK